MRLIKKYWPLVGIGITLFIIGFYLLGARDEFVREPVESDTKVEDGIHLEGIHYAQENPEKRIKWFLDASEVSFSKDRQVVSFNNFKLKLEAEKRPSIELVGKHGDYNKNSGEINLHGDLHGHSDSGYRIITEHILYQYKEGYLKTDEWVRIIGPFFSIAGKGFYFNLENESIRILSEVTTDIERDLLIL